MQYTPAGPPPRGAPSCPPFPYAVERYGQLYRSASTPITPFLCAKCGVAGPTTPRALRVTYAPSWIIFMLCLYPFVRKTRTIDVALCPKCDARARAATLHLYAGTGLVLVAGAVGLVVAQLLAPGVGVWRFGLMYGPLGLVAVAGVAVLLHMRLRDLTLRLEAVEPLFEVHAPPGTEAQRISGLHPAVISATCQAAAAAWHPRTHAFAASAPPYGARTW